MANFKRAAQVAQETLEKHSIASPPVPIVDLAESYGFRVRAVDFAEYSTGVAGFIDPKAGVIFVNKDDSDHRKAFTIAHELGHYLLHRTELEKNPNLSILFRIPLGSPDPNPLEQEANAFAGRLLVPSDLLRDYLKEGVREPTVLSDIFGVSQDVIIYRLKDEQRGRN